MTITQNYKQQFFTLSQGITTPVLTWTHLAFCTRYDQPTTTDNLANNNSELDRIALNTSDISWTNNLVTITTTIASNKVVCPTSTIVSIDPSNTIYALTPATFGAFKLGDRVEVPTLAGYIEGKIVNRDTNLNTVTLSAPIAGVVGQDIHIKVSTVAILCNASLTPSPSTDLVFKWIPQSFYKDSTSSRSLTMQFEFKG